MTDAERIHEIAREVARETVKEMWREMFKGLGVDTSDPEAVIKMQADFAHLRSWRESTDAVKRNSLKAAVTIVVTGALGWIGTVLWHAR